MSTPPLNINMPPSGPQPQVQIVVSLYPGGQVTVNGPLENKVAMYGLLELAKEIVMKNEPKSGPTILPVRSMG